MNQIHILTLVLLISSCASHDGTREHNRTANDQRGFTEQCPSCGVKHTYQYSFDERDYRLIADFCSMYEGDGDRAVSWKAPHAASPSCSSSYSTDLSWAFLHREMPHLERSTFDDFLQRNDPIPAHKIYRWRDSQGGVVRVIHGDPSRSRARWLSRGGFSNDGKQALIYGGGGVIHLFCLKNGKWFQIDTATLWRS
jgi:hypothetical protein